MQTPDMGRSLPPSPLYADIGAKMSHYLKLSLNSLCGDWAPRGGVEKGEGGEAFTFAS